MSARTALSLKQPWATLLAYGIKTIEIRRWSTPRVGTIFIHASRQRDRRQEAWDLVPRELLPQTELKGGIVGVAELVACRQYRSKRAFARDRRQHRNPIDWFQPPRMYGFVFADARPLPFEPVKGTLYFFEIPGVPAPDAR